MPSPVNPDTVAALSVPAVDVRGLAATVGEAFASPTAPTLPSNVTYRHYRPLSEAADEWVRFACDTDSRIYTGMASFDEAMRGIAPSELCQVVGASHAGKTVWVSQLVLHNNTARIAWFTPDETRQLVLLKLASLAKGVSAPELERRVHDGDTTAEAIVRHTATDLFPSLAVFDDLSDLSSMQRALDEAQEVWGAPAELVIFDYVGLLSDAEDTKQKFKALKSWGKHNHVPLVAVHQASRAKGSDGQRIDMDSGEYGGQAESTFIVGVRRKRFQYRAMLTEMQLRKERSTKDSSGLSEAILDAEDLLLRHQDSITFSLVKNKRPPGALVDDQDYRLDGKTGRISEGEFMNTPVIEQEDFF